MKILLVEDSKAVAEVVYDYFEGAQFEGVEYVLDYAPTGSLGFQLAQENRYDCIILDIMLPGMDGISVCKELRALGNDTPIIMLTARDTNQDMLTGLKTGADDYVVKPFDLELLEARIEAIIRRTKGSGFKTSLTVGDLTMDLSSHQVIRSGQNIKLNPSNFKVLKLLMEKHPVVATREEIEHLLWPDEQPDQDILRKHIYQLRSKLDKPFENEILKTVPKTGYKLEE
ncbi:response regulator transcription factor [Pseudoalteromonas sp. C2R02]|uniref:response regulator transcription factor n=1 Tax=Pseudoalteromonas sp. C2R02 TaxID=2841565 RepID=UPI001C098E44|nr:response regulator transcription factor [Pseudoalteromonas sp. C2R02]